MQFCPQALLPTIFNFLLASLSGTMAQNNASNNNFLGSTPTQRHIINQTQAQSVISAAAASATTVGSPSNIAVTDSSGFLVAFLRTDNAFLASIDISMKKARTVSLFNGAFTTQGLYNSSQPGQSLYGMSWVCPFPAPLSPISPNASCSQVRGKEGRNPLPEPSEQAKIVKNA